MVARGIMLGPEQPVILHLLDIPPAAQALEGVRMELIDAAFPLVQGTACYISLLQALNRQHSVDTSLESPALLRPLGSH